MAGIRSNRSGNETFADLSFGRRNRRFVPEAREQRLQLPTSRQKLGMNGVLVQPIHRSEHDRDKGDQHREHESRPPAGRLVLQGDLEKAVLDSRNGSRSHQNTFRSSRICCSCSASERSTASRRDSPGSGGRRR